MQQAVHQVVADEGTGGVGYAGGDAGGPDVFYHGFDGERGKVGRGPVRTNGLVDRLVAFIVLDSGVINVDGDPFRGQVVLAAGLADAEDRVGLFPFDGGVDNVDGFAEYGRDFQLDDFDITDPAGKELDGF